MKAWRVLALALLAGCGSTSTYRVVTGPVAPARAGDVRVFMENAALPSDYVEVAIVQAVGRGNQADVAHVIEGLRAEAAMLGGEAVVGVHVDEGATLASGTGVAVRWRPGPPPAPRSPAAAPWTAPQPAAPPAGVTAPAPWAATSP